MDYLQKLRSGKHRKTQNRGKNALEALGPSGGSLPPGALPVGSSDVAPPSPSTAQVKLEVGEKTSTSEQELVQLPQGGSVRVLPREGIPFMSKEQATLRLAALEKLDHYLGEALRHP